MNKDEILEKSKEENKNADPYEMEVTAKAHINGMWGALLCAAVLTFIKFIKEDTFDLSIVAMLLVLNAVVHTYKAVKLKEKKFVTQAVLYCIAAVLETGSAIVQIMFQG
ncbi:MAG: DUF6442 family protein [Ruminococcus sp.]|nr:DUF6442 family protein [Ruminococcus sp.]MCM1478845.1 DUF6442 family protein [Muribaculaceae bacterium]